MDFTRGDSAHKSLDVGIDRTSEQEKRMKEMYEFEAKMKIEYIKEDFASQLRMQKEMIKFQLEFQKASNVKLS